MRLTQIFFKTSHNIPENETALNAQLLIRAGYINKQMAGAYNYLPLGLMVIENIKQVVREEMLKIQASELLMTSLQPADIWQKTGRWDDQVVDIWFKSKLKNNQAVGFGWSHEEPLMAMINQYVDSYRDLPIYVFQFQTKLRNELRAKSGVMRGREFLMKDMYSFCLNQQQLDDFYNKTIEAYLTVYERLGLGDITYLTYASGGAFTGKYSHEFQTVTSAGEDEVYIDHQTKLAINKEIYSTKTAKELGLKISDTQAVKTAEVGNIFNFGATKAEDMAIHYIDEKSKSQPIYLGSYGIGISRLMGVIAEVTSDQKGLVWPKIIAPALVYLIAIDDKTFSDFTETVYNLLTKNKVSVIYDDRDIRLGQKFTDFELIGVPYRVIINSDSIKNKTVEVTARQTGQPTTIPLANLIKYLKN